MKTILFSCITAFALISIVGCSCDKPASSTTTQSASMQTDSKDMQAHH
jgi:uncharacterized protein YcfL